MTHSSPDQVTSRDASARPTHVVLVPGFWLGAWAWDDVLPHLRERGLTATALTLPGLEPDHPDRGAVTLEDHVRAVEDAVATAPEGSRVVLVAHSGAAAPATVALDRHVDQVAHVVWVDTAPAGEGFAMDAGFDGDDHPVTAQWDDELAQGSMRGLTDEQLRTFRHRAVPQPGAALREPVSLSDDRRHDVPMTLVATSWSSEDYRAWAEEGGNFLAALPDYRDLTMIDLPTGHWPMWSEPRRLAEVIADAALA
ncbi:alpha/beta fold hydrolase [Ornithinimicrobium pekingense]|uniref:Esterase n=1 Tax=Ornithinimicrobium pekingense TaxID=384677 RepID=A0ABQ2FFB3_9MICO|nr:alpha/beta fold hydrolase [Ornithinimicrobium pekingense]GGK82183.1 esterase [Ornithinimicrobium pekingense]